MGSIACVDGSCATRDGLSLRFRAWQPGNAQAVLLVLHGLAEHSGRYLHVGARFAGAGYAVYALDHRGHGRSPGPRVHVAAFDEFLEDVDALRAVAEAEHPGRPLVLVGHSHGGRVLSPAGRAPVVPGLPWPHRPGSRPLGPLARRAAAEPRRCITAQPRPGRGTRLSGGLAGQPPGLTPLVHLGHAGDAAGPRACCAARAAPTSDGVRGRPPRGPRGLATVCRPRSQGQAGSRALGWALPRDVQ